MNLLFQISEKIQKFTMDSFPIINSLVEEIYHFGEVIGVGQFGEVKLASSYSNGNLYACKSIQKPVSKSKDCPRIVINLVSFLCRK